MGSGREASSGVAWIGFRCFRRGYERGFIVQIGHGAPVVQAQTSGQIDTTSPELRCTVRSPNSYSAVSGSCQVLIE
ncbi:hypothetical protein Ciccas_012123 [Cichlidogyrus casuarinus]|uniref:Uncharacterized protein n=1 Tax=Cichlidogyrus casuarinus TaxID=1844966 RepID=A0ABD2PPC2_9PLAT